MSEETRLDFRSLADSVSDQKDFVDPSCQGDHPAMNYLRDMVHYNGMDADGKYVYDAHNYYNNGKISAKDAYEAMEEVKSGKVDKSGLEEKFYRGLMTDAHHYHYRQEKNDNPGITAKQYFDKFCKQYELHGVQKLANSFEALIKEPHREKPDNSPHFTKAQVEKMSREEIRKNYDAITKSMKKWK